MIDIIERLRVCAKFDPDQADAIVEIERLREAIRFAVEAIDGDDVIAASERLSTGLGEPSS